MKTQLTTNSPANDNRVFLNGKRLAEVLKVSAPSLSEAVKKGYNCAGYPVCEWAVETGSGRIKGYKVPKFLVSDDQQEVDKRANPEDKTPEKPNIRPNKEIGAPNKPTGVTKNSYSLLPAGQDYVRPAGMIALPSVLKKALEQDTPQSQAVITGGLAGIGAIIGHTVTEKGIGAILGAITGIGISYYTYKAKTNLSNINQIRHRSFRSKAINSNKQSNFLPS